MNPALQQLKDIHLPPAIHNWPIAPGWLTLYFIILSLVCFSIYYIYRLRKKRYTIKYALRHLQQLQSLTQHNPHKINIAAELSTLIRRTALHYFPRETIAGLTGQDWLNFLNKSSNSEVFTGLEGQLLIDAPYQPAAQHNLSALFNLTRQWLIDIDKNSRR